MGRSGRQMRRFGNYKFGTTSTKLLLPRGAASGAPASDRSATLQDGMGGGACTGAETYPREPRSTREYSQVPDNSNNEYSKARTDTSTLDG